MAGWQITIFNRRYMGVEPKIIVGFDLQNVGVVVPTTFVRSSFYSVGSN